MYLAGGDDQVEHRHDCFVPAICVQVRKYRSSSPADRGFRYVNPPYSRTRSRHRLSGPYVLGERHLGVPSQTLRNAHDISRRRRICVRPRLYMAHHWRSITRGPLAAQIRLLSDSR